MDDTYVIMKTKEELRALLAEIGWICIRLGIHINPKKTKIQPITTEMYYLKINYRIFSTGRILQIVPNHIFAREKHNINKFYYLYAGRMTLLRTGLRNLPTIPNCPKIGQFRKVKFTNF